MQVQSEASCFVDACEAMGCSRYGEAMRGVCHCIALHPQRLDYHAMLVEIVHRCSAAGGPVPVQCVDARDRDCRLIACELAWLQNTSDESLARALIESTYLTEAAHPGLNLSKLRSWVQYLLLAAQHTRHKRSVA